MKVIGPAVLLVACAGLAGAAQAPDTISDPGDALERSTAPPAYAPLPTRETGPSQAPSPEERAEAARREEQELPPPSSALPPPPPAYMEVQEGLDAPGTGKLIRGRGGHDHVERPGGALLLDAEGRRLEIIPEE